MKHKMKLWEYLVVCNADIGKLNELGINGWELISIIYFPPSTSTLSLTTFYFKRQMVM